MARLRAHLWFFVLLAFAVPNIGTALAGHARVAPDQSTAGCPEHAPPPQPCPLKDTAKHAAGLCCSLMSSALAVLPAVADGDAVLPLPAPDALPAPNLAGHFPAKDPPPPRV